MLCTLHSYCLFFIHCSNPVVCSNFVKKYTQRSVDSNSVTFVRNSYDWNFSENKYNCIVLWYSKYVVLGNVPSQTVNYFETKKNSNPPPMGNHYKISSSMSSRPLWHFSFSLAFSGSLSFNPSFTISMHTRFVKIKRMFFFVFPSSSMLKYFKSRKAFGHHHNLAHLFTMSKHLFAIFSKVIYIQMCGNHKLYRKEREREKKTMVESTQYFII